VPHSEPRTGYMMHLDGIRAFAVGGVILEHWASGLPRFIRELLQALDLGGLGVQCFFVLSGFLITLILLDSKEQNFSLGKAIGHFYVRRALRIFPAYYVALLALVLILPEMYDAIVWHALYLSNLYPVWHGNWPPIGGHFWSLSVEEQFYLFWPMIVLVLPLRMIMFASLACCLLAPLSRMFLWNLMGEGHLAIYTVTTTALDLLCFGAFLACVKHEIGLSADSIHVRRLRLVGLIALLLYVVLYFHFRDTLLFTAIGRTLTALFFGALIVVASNGFKGPAGLLFGNKIIVWVGITSYGLYIFHPFIPQVYLFLLDFLGLERDIFAMYYIRYPLLTILLLLVTSASFYLIEKPVRKFRRYFS
jgi:peptidoglycan/LPS O-acetylase OafA/YrhL